MRKRRHFTPARPFPLFGALTIALLAGSGLGLFLLARLVIRPDVQVNSMQALPAYNIAGQRTEQADFWAVAQYHDLPPTGSSNARVFAVEALSRTGATSLLAPLMDCGRPCSLEAPDQAAEPFWYYDDLLQQLTCTFWDDIPCGFSDYTDETISGTVDVSLGWPTGTSVRPLCYTAVFTPNALSDGDVTNAYASVIDDLQQLCNGTINSFYSVENLLMDLDSQVFVTAGMPGRAAGNLALLGNEMGRQLLELYQSGAFPYDLDDPVRCESLLQEHFLEQGLTLQVLSLDQCYLVLISTQLDSGSATLGLYYSPVLDTWCGLGLQLQ